MTRLKPLAKERRHPVDYRDEIEHEAVAAILSELPDDHIAIYAYYAAARSAADSISMTHLIGFEYWLICERLVEAYMGASRRIGYRHSSTIRSGVPKSHP